MPDKLTAEQRHKCMSRIRGKDTKPEMKVRKYLYSHGFRYRLHVKRLPGTPDIVIRRLHTIILVNGCFWHHHDCHLFVMPKSNTQFWQAKIKRNEERDVLTKRECQKLGWNVITLWECQLNDEQTLKSLVYTLAKIELDLGKPKVRPYKLNSDNSALVADDSETYEH